MDKCDECGMGDVEENGEVLICVNCGCEACIHCEEEYAQCTECDGVMRLAGDIMEM